jgi:hypothetical protein
LLDVFSADAFNVTSMTAAINRMPYTPGRIGKMNLFTPKPITTTTAVLEYASGRLRLLQSGTRGGDRPNMVTSKKRKVRSFVVPHVPDYGQILADDVQGVRAFGSETNVETVAQLVNDHLEQMRAGHEVTHEYHRAGCLCGIVLDADGSQIYDYFTEFGVSEVTHTLSRSADAGTLKVAIGAIKRSIEDELGAIPYKGIHVLCDDAFFDDLLKAAGVQEAYDRWQDGQFFRDGHGRDDGGFLYGGITWENYRGKVDSTSFLQGTGVGRAFPTGVKDLFQQAMAPADYVETVNTRGKVLYSKQEPMKFNKGVDIESQSNVLFIPTIPRVLQKISWGA